MKKKTIRDIAVNGKRVFVRVDFNVPMDEAGHITNDNRIQASLSTIKYLCSAGAKVILACHLGRPKGKVVPELSVLPVAKHLEKLLQKKVAFAKDCVGSEAKNAVAKLQDGEILLLENLRFHKEETDNEAQFARQLADLADIAVDDAFGVAHRAHASNVGIGDYLEIVSGLLMEKEVDALEKVLNHPEAPFVAVIGGAKVSDKIDVIENILPKVNTLIIGGGMAYTFLAAKGYSIGKSLFEADKVSVAKEVMATAEKNKVEIILPVDVVEANKFAADADYKVVPADAIDDDYLGLDCGPQTIALNDKAVRGAKMILWNGPLGVFEFPAFAVGTNEMAESIANSGAYSIVGGGDSIAALEKSGLAARISHISTGGGATLQFLEGKTLPALKIIADLT